MKPKHIAIISGVTWTVIAALLLPEGSAWGRISDLRWWACLAGPIVGIATYYLSRWSYKKKFGVRVLWAVLSLYLASGLYGLLLGILAGFHPLRPSDETVYEFIAMPLPIWWGLTFIPLLWPLFAISFFNHWLIARHEEKWLSKKK